MFKNCGFIDDFIGTDFRGLSENHSFKDEHMKFVADDPSNTIYYKKLRLIEHSVS